MCPSDQIAHGKRVLLLTSAQVILRPHLWLFFLCLVAYLYFTLPDTDYGELLVYSVTGSIATGYGQECASGKRSRRLLPGPKFALAGLLRASLVSHFVQNRQVKRRKLTLRLGLVMVRDTVIIRDEYLRRRMCMIGAD